MFIWKKYIEQIYLKKAKKLFSLIFKETASYTLN